ncbi:MAG: nitrophenyl compound nitroreductase subunit ArsF family protein [Thermoguttaceae bacterium]|nr:nitrophenyl compound nitroreductase subunit ArsF family protein [Thermoguttaceae bacterium]MDW8037686.1 nitrophenyl compound nitroreductase subunit ArsF family protein [Thermoguttaceae bacterium]
MELKQALAVSLIAVVAASLVLLIARALDVQTASRLEPQLAQIVEELQTVRKLLSQGRATAGGGIPTLANPPASSNGQTSSPASSGDSSGLPSGGQETLVVWYFHGTMRCPTCQAIEALAHEIVQSDFAQELASGRVVWKTANYEKPMYSALAKKLDVRMPVVALVRMQDGHLLESKTLDEVWGLVQDKSQFREFLVREIRQMLAGRKTDSAPSTQAGEPASGKTGPNSEKRSASTGDSSLAPRPNLLRLHPPEAPPEKSPDSLPPEVPNVQPQ